jgi:hypothetical protein
MHMHVPAFSRARHNMCCKMQALHTCVCSLLHNNCIVSAENVVRAGQQVPPAFSGSDAGSWGAAPPDTLQ